MGLKKRGILGSYYGVEEGIYRGKASTAYRGIYVKRTHNLDKVQDIFGRCPLWDP
jgi:hypothetical protein